MIDRYFIGVATGITAVIGPLSLVALVRYLARGPKLPLTFPLPECRSLGMPGGSNCVLLLGHRNHHRNSGGQEWPQYERVPLNTERHRR